MVASAVVCLDSNGSAAGVTEPHGDSIAGSEIDYKYNFPGTTHSIRDIEIWDAQKELFVLHDLGPRVWELAPASCGVVVSAPSSTMLPIGALGRTGVDRNYYDLAVLNEAGATGGWSRLLYAGEDGLGVLR